MNIMSFYSIMIIYGVIFSDQIGNNNMINILNNNNIIFNNFIHNIFIQTLLILTIYNLNMERYLRIINNAILIIFIVYLFSNLFIQDEFKLEKIDIITTI